MKSICACGHSYENHDEDLQCQKCNTNDACTYYQESRHVKILTDGMTESDWQAIKTLVDRLRLAGWIA